MVFQVQRTLGASALRSAGSAADSPTGGKAPSVKGTAERLESQQRPALAKDSCEDVSTSHPSLQVFIKEVPRKG